MRVQQSADERVAASAHPQKHAIRLDVLEVLSTEHAIDIGPRIVNDLCRFYGDAPKRTPDAGVVFEFVFADC